MAHGLAWIAYIGFMPFGLAGRSFPVMTWLRTLLASFIPLGTFWNERYLRAA